MYLDIFSGIMLFFYITSGLSKGFFVEFISLFAILGNFYLTGYLTPLAIKALENKLPGINYIFVYVAIFFIAYAFIMAFTSLLNVFFKNQHKSIFTRLGGALIAAIKGTIVLLILITFYNIVVKIEPDYKKYSDNSYVIEKYDAWIHGIYEYIPPEIKDSIEEFRKNKLIDRYIKKAF